MRENATDYDGASQRRGQNQEDRPINTSASRESEVKNLTHTSTNTRAERISKCNPTRCSPRGGTKIKVNALTDMKTTRGENKARDIRQPESEKPQRTKNVNRFGAGLHGAAKKGNTHTQTTTRIETAQAVGTHRGGKNPAQTSTDVLKIPRENRNFRLNALKFLILLTCRENLMSDAPVCCPSRGLGTPPLLRVCVCVL